MPLAAVVPSVHVEVRINWRCFGENGEYCRLDPLNPEQRHDPRNLEVPVLYGFGESTGLPHETNSKLKNVPEVHIWHPDTTTIAG